MTIVRGVVRQTVGTARHVSGAWSKDQDDDPMAVADQYFRVKGVQGLWVADASVMPRIPQLGQLACNGDHDRRTGSSTGLRQELVAAPAIGCCIRRRADCTSWVAENLPVGADSGAADDRCLGEGAFRSLCLHGNSNPLH